jgi:hypothetical protein
MGSDLFPFAVNLLAVGIVLIAMLALLVLAALEKELRRGLLWEHHPATTTKSRVPKSRVAIQPPSTAIAFWFFFATFVLTAITYALHYFAPSEECERSTAHEVASLTHQISHIIGDLIGNAASLSLLIAAVAYCWGEGFRWAKAVQIAFLIVLVMGLWGMAWELLEHRQDFFETLLVHSPGIIIAAIATTALGWAVFARWGGVIGFAFFLLAVAYAILQLPANLLLGLTCFVKATTADLRLTFSLLAAGKLFLSFGFLALLCNSRKVKDIDEPQYWPPRHRVPPPIWFYGSTVSSIIIGVIIHTIANLIAEHWH